MSIGATIKKLRRQHDMTQEQLADLLNLTPAAISGWECDRNAPDISQIPLLSHIFGVSADILLGIDLSLQEEKINKIIVEAGKCNAKEAVGIYRLGLAEFPASYRLMLRLADLLVYEGEPETYDSRCKERIALYERIREGTKDAHLKNHAEGMLCGIYLRQGKREEAVKIAEGVPNFLFSHSDLELMVAQGKDKIYNLHHKIHCDFIAVCSDIFRISTLRVDGKPFFTHKQAITILEKIPKMYEVFYENQDYFLDADQLERAYTHMAEHYAELHDANNAIYCIKLALESAKQVDEYYEGLNNGPYGISETWDYPQMPKEKRQTSILVNPDFEYPTTTVWIDKSGESEVQRLKRDLLHTRFDFIRDEIEKITM